jgi:hypothetical protein
MGSAEGSTLRNFVVCSVRMIISVIIKWTGHVARMEEVGVISKF